MMKASSIEKRRIPSIRIPVAPPAKSMPTTRDYDRKKQKLSGLKEIEEQEHEKGDR